MSIPYFNTTAALNRHLSLMKRKEKIEAATRMITGEPKTKKIKCYKFGSHKNAHLGFPMMPNLMPIYYSDEEAHRILFKRRNRRCENRNGITKKGRQKWPRK